MIAGAADEDVWRVGAAQVTVRHCCSEAEVRLLLHHPAIFTTIRAFESLVFYRVAAYFEAASVVNPVLCLVPGRLRALLLVFIHVHVPGKYDSVMISEEHRRTAHVVESHSVLGTPLAEI